MAAPWSQSLGWEDVRGWCTQAFGRLGAVGLEGTTSTTWTLRGLWEMRGPQSLAASSIDGVALPQMPDVTRQTVVTRCGVG